MRLVVIADTHAKSYNELPSVLQEEIGNSDAVIHAGDFGSSLFYQELSEKTKILYGVSGNNDNLDIPQELVLNLEGVKAAVIHSDIVRGDRTNYLIYHFYVQYPKLIIFGHTHKPCWLQVGDQVLLNPGSPTKNRGVGYNSYAILTVNGHEFDVDFKKIIFS